MAGSSPPIPRRSHRAALLLAVLLLSGAAGLGYELAWTRMFAVGLGAEMASVLAIVSAFFTGLALGGWMFNRVLVQSPRPIHWYAGFELAIGAWALLSVVLIPACNELAFAWISAETTALRQWTISFAIPLLALLPATTAMGATLPAMERGISRLPDHARCVGSIYAANTIGAAAGVLLSAFVLVPRCGYRLTVEMFAGLNLICACAALFAQRGLGDDAPAQAGARTATGSTAPMVAAAPVAAPVPAASAAAATRQSLSRARLFLILAATGALGIGYEVLGIRVLAQIAANTVYTFAAALIVFLLGTAVGAAVYQRLLQRIAARRPISVLSGLLACLCATCLAGMAVMTISAELDSHLRDPLGTTLVGATLREGLVSASVFAAPTLVMGALFSHLVQMARRDDRAIGSAIAINTLAGAAAPAIFGVWLLPWIGAGRALLLVAIGYLAVIPRAFLPAIAALAIMIGVFIFKPPDLAIVPLSSGETLRRFRDGALAAVAVVQQEDGTRILKVNNRFQMGSTSHPFSALRMGHIPLLLHPDPKRALFLGLGTGITCGSVAMHPGLEGTAVELLPEVVDVMDEFQDAGGDPHNHAGARIVVADARRFVRADTGSYDVIVGELFHPSRDGAGSLYTLEHFRAVKDRLAPGGLFAQWLPLYQLDEPMTRVIVRTFLEVFPETKAFICHFNVDTPALALVGSEKPLVYSADWYRRRVHSPALQAALEECALDDELRLFGCLLADRAELERYAGDAPINTDDRPVVMFGAPAFAYSPNPHRWGRLLPFIANHSEGVDSLLADGDNPNATELERRRLRSFIDARNVFLHGMILGTQGDSAGELDGYIESARLSPDFLTGYAVAFNEARRIEKSSPRDAIAILRRLIAAHPGVEAGERELLRLTGQ